MVLVFMTVLGFSLHNRVETVVLVSGILNGTDGAVGVVQAVHALHVLTVTRLVLVLVVTGVRVLDFVFILVFGVSVVVNVVFTMVVFLLVMSRLNVVYSGSFMVYSDGSFVVDSDGSSMVDSHGSLMMDSNGSLMVHGNGDVMDWLLVHNMFPTMVALAYFMMSLGSTVVALANFLVSMRIAMVTLAYFLVSMRIFVSVGDVVADDGLGGVGVALFMTMLVMVLGTYRCDGDDEDDFREHIVRICCDTLKN
ncbi:unnamed protein product [Spodoptera littoralis]|uniref:Uncharacterized protein n=1 Tax=Spodoptera littoralis TaxID=7109 RepID=A0A9P0N4G8_SPOLI|nr:unnamed protein product [Spodoptera littoralis]CAH1644462.1 unnamed protein product [Spodoptera littoralis]